MDFILGLKNNVDKGIVVEMIIMIECKYEEIKLIWVNGWYRGIWLGNLRWSFILKGYECN